MSSQTVVPVTVMFEQIREGFRPFYDLVKGFHEANPSTRQRGHGMEHNVHVALHGMDIVVEDFAADPFMMDAIFLASIGHSLDRLVERGDDNGFAGLVATCLETVDHPNPAMKVNVKNAILEHGKKNDPNDGMLTVILKDADRVANIGAALAIRSGQFYSGLPPYEMAYLRTVNPAHTYHDPASVLEDLRECFVWGDWMRTRRGQQMFNLKSANLQDYLFKVAAEFEMIGMDTVTI